MPIVSANVTLLTHRPTVTRVISIWNHIKPITKTYFLPVAISYALVFPNISRSSPRPIVLHATIDVIWKFIIHGYVIKLRHRKIANKSPRFSTIFGNIHTTIVTINHKTTIFRMNPPCMMVWVNTITYTIGRHELSKVFTTIFRNVYICEYRIYTVFILRIYVNFRVVKRTISNIIFIVDFLPFKTTIFTFVQSIFFCFN